MGLNFLSITGSATKHPSRAESNAVKPVSRHDTAKHSGLQQIAEQRGTRIFIINNEDGALLRHGHL
jgi:hypothetical protein